MGRHGERSSQRPTARSSYGGPRCTRATYGPQRCAGCRDPALLNVVLRGLGRCRYPRAQLLKPSQITLCCQSQQPHEAAHRVRAGLGPVRIHTSDPQMSTDRRGTARPHPGDLRVVQIPSTTTAVEIASAQVGRLCICGSTKSTACGQFSGRQHASGLVHWLPTGKGRLSPGSPQPCPLFGKATRHITGSSEPRHTNPGGWPVENRGKSGDGAVGKLPFPVYGLCRTLRSPQIPPVHPPVRPQATWIKKWA